MFFQQTYVSLTKTIGFRYVADEVNIRVEVTWNLVVFCYIGNDTSCSNGHVFWTTTITSKEAI
jgi:hypothetical protein